jgi:hypothetical protein
MIWMTESLRESHNAIETRSTFLASIPCFIFRFLSCSLSGRSCFELSSDGLKKIWDFDPAFQEEQLEIPGFILQLNLIPVLQNLVNGALAAIKCKNLAPVRSFHSIESSHQGILFFCAPGPPLTRQTRSPSTSRADLGYCGLSSSLIEHTCGLRLCRERNRPLTILWMICAIWALCLVQMMGSCLILASRSE